MDKEHVKGAADKAKGAMKDAAGKMIGDNSGGDGQGQGRSPPSSWRPPRAQLNTCASSTRP